MAPSEILTLSEAAALIRVSRKTLGELARSQRVPAKKVGREWRFLRSALEAWLAGQDESTAEDPAEADPAAIADRTAQYRLRLPGFGDTAFSENHKRRLHRWVPWIAGFSSSFVTGVLDEVRRNGERLQVLDPFAGVGTTLDRGHTERRRRHRFRDQPLRGPRVQGQGASCRVRRQPLGVGHRTLRRVW